MKSNLTKWFRTVEIFVRKFFGSMMQVHSEDVVDGWTSSWSLYRWGTDKHRAWQACCRVSCERCKGKFVLMFPVSRYSWKRMYLYLHPNCMVQYTWKWDTTLVVFAIQTSSFWTASYLMYTVVSIISILYIHVFNISQKSTRNWGEWRCLRSFMWLWNPIFGQRIRVHHMHWWCCDGIRLWRSSREFHRPGRPVKQLKIEAKCIPKLKLLYWSTGPRGISQGIPFGWWNFECLWVHTPHLHRRCDGWLPRDSCARHHWTSLLGAEV